MSDYRLEEIQLDKTILPVQERKHFGQEELEELAATISIHGVLEPIIVVRDGDAYLVIAGQRRVMAAQLAGRKMIPAVVHDKPLTEVESKEIRLIENLARAALRPLEQSAGLDQLMKASGLSASAVAKRVGMKPAAVTKSLSLLHLPEPIRQQVDAGLISSAAGYELARIEDPQLRAQFAAQVAAGTLTRDALAGKIKAIRRPVAESTKTTRSRVTARLSADRLVTVCANNLTVDSVIAALEDLLSRCRAARTKGLGLGTMLKVFADESKRS